MQQLTLSRQSDFQRFTKKTRREQFLEEMDAVMPWAELLGLVAPSYSKGETGRKPLGVEIMLWVYFLQQWFSLSDPAAEDTLYESAVLRRFAGVDSGRAPALDETTILNFRHLPEEHELCGQMLDAVNDYLESRGIRIATGIRRGGSMQRLFMRRRRPRTRRRSAIRRCIRRAKGISGTSG
jgi:IS5 family transposase